MIKVEGLTVQPEEVESVLLTCTGVRRAVVTGLGGGGDESTGVGALIVVEPGKRFTTAEVEAHCHRGLSSYKVPQLRVIDEDESPRSSSLKADRIAARTLLHERSAGR